MGVDCVCPERAACDAIIATMKILMASSEMSPLARSGGLGDVLAWITLGIPVGVCAWFGWRRSPGH